jgi:hypothetical protein
MSNTTFETFLVSGLLVLIAAVAYLAWSAWRWVDRERDMEKLALTGVSHELRLNLKRMLAELAGVANGTLQSEIDIVPVIHPQLDALLSRPNEADRRGLTIIRGNYNELSAHKQSLRAALANQNDVGPSVNVAVDAVIDSLTTLYLWEEHKGRPPEAAQSTRSWDVRDWMKAHKFHADMLPGLHLRDQVVERLRSHGMTLTPKPLTFTASEYFAMQYDRKADPNAPFWKRKAKPVAAEEVETIMDEEPVEPAEIETAPEPEHESEIAVDAAPEYTPEGEAETSYVDDAPVSEPSSSAEPETSEPGSESIAATKPLTPGIVH